MLQVFSLCRNQLLSVCHLWRRQSVQVSLWSVISRSHLIIRASWCWRCEGNEPKATIGIHNCLCCRKSEKCMSQTSILHHLPASMSRIYHHDHGSVRRCLVLIHIQLKSTLKRGRPAPADQFCCRMGGNCRNLQAACCRQKHLHPPEQWSLSLRWSFRSRRWEEVSYLVLRSNYTGYIS